MPRLSKIRTVDATAVVSGRWGLSITEAGRTWSVLGKRLRKREPVYQPDRAESVDLGASVSGIPAPSFLVSPKRGQS